MGKRKVSRQIFSSSEDGSSSSSSNSSSSESDEGSRSNSPVRNAREFILDEAEEKRSRKRKKTIPSTSKDKKTVSTKGDKKEKKQKRGRKDSKERMDSKEGKEDSKDKKKVPKPKKPEKKTSKKDTTEEEGIVKRNFAPGNEPETTVNKVHWEGSLGSDYSIKLHTWSQNSNSYMNIRKGKTAGTNVPVQLYWRLVQALDVMREDNPSVILPRPSE